jgi:putative ABC transport system permease protein
MTATTLPRQGPSPTASRLPLVLNLALREQRNGLSGFYIFIFCVALGVAAITGVGALADAMRASFERQGEVLLGGDVTLSRPHQAADDAALSWLRQQGKLSETATVRAMARTLDGAEQTLAEVRGVDAAYPLVGAFKLSSGMPLDEAVHGDMGAVVDPILLERLGVKIGDRITVGTVELPIRATIEAEPDKLTERLTGGPRVLVSLETLRRSGLVEPGSLVSWRYALKLGDGAAGSDTGLIKFRDGVKTALPEHGFTVRDRRDPSPQITRTLERLRQFLTLVGLTALLVGGVGIANAVATYIDRRRKIIAAFKSLGATNRIVFGVHLLQVLFISGIGVVAGMAVGLLIPFAVTALIGSTLPIQAEVALSARSVLTAAGYGFLVALLFTLWPLGRAGQVRAGVLFRDEVAPEQRLPPLRILVATLVTALVLGALAVLTSEAPWLALYYCLGVIGVFAVFLALGSGLNWLARRVPRPRQPELGLAIGNIGAPGGLTRAVVLSLGTGLSLLVTVALVDRSIVAELTDRLPEESPNYFVLDVKREEADAFQALVRRDFPGAKVQQAPMLRGRIVKVGDRPAEEVKAGPEAKWVLTGDRGLTYSATVPEGTSVVSGTWWPADYAGPPLVSFEAEIAKGLGLKVGDAVTVNVLGRNVTASIANLREKPCASRSAGSTIPGAVGECASIRQPPASRSITW